jgi:phosphoribosyl-AMP cyclohydrolase
MRFIVAIIQDAETKEVLMQGFMNPIAWHKTQETKRVHFWSTSRNKIWRKGSTSGNEMEVVYQLLDCDCDAVLIGVKVLGDGVACHTGKKSCFHNDIYFEGMECPRCKTVNISKLTRRYCRPRDFNGRDDDFFWYCSGCGWSIAVE